MLNYVVTFTGYIDQRKRPENFPTNIQDVVVGPFETSAHLVDFVNKRVALYAANQGMGVTLDQNLMEDLRIVDTNRMWVPMHMITHFTASYKSLTGEVPQISASGEVSLLSGKQIVKH